MPTFPAGGEAAGEVDLFFADVHQLKGEPFRVLSTTRRTQLAVITVPPGRSTGSETGHPQSDQLTLVLEGRVELVGGGETRELRAGEVVVIPPETPYRFRTLGRRSATLVVVYGPPAHPAEAEHRTGPATHPLATADTSAMP